MFARVRWDVFFETKCSCTGCRILRWHILLGSVVAGVHAQPMEKATLGQRVTLPCHIDYSDVSGSPSNIPVISLLL